MAKKSSESRVYVIEEKWHIQMRKTGSRADASRSLQTVSASLQTRLAILSLRELIKPPNCRGRACPSPLRFQPHGASSSREDGGASSAPTNGVTSANAPTLENVR